MTFDELIRLLIDSNTNDWLRDDGRGIYTLKSDLNVTVREVTNEEPQPFKTEEWATSFVKPAFTQAYELWYGASFVKQYYFAAVDDDRARLPYPKSRDELTITREQYAIACAVDMFNSVDEYLERAGVGVR